MAPIGFLAKSRPYIQRQNLKFISTFVHLQAEPQLAEPPASIPPPLPPNPASGSPRYSENWRNPSAALAGDGALVPVGLGFLQQNQASRMQVFAQSLDAESLINQFADWMTTQRWDDMKQLFESWIRSLDRSGKPNTPDVNLYNHYLRANVMSGASTEELLGVLAQMEDYGIAPNSASFNLVLKAMQRSGDMLAAEKLIERMLETGKIHKESLPDNESFDLVIEMLLSKNHIDSALKYVDLTLKSGYMLSMKAFMNCVQRCVTNGRLDTLVSIIERCKKMDQNKSLCPPWRICTYIADVAMQSDNSVLVYYAFEFMAKWIARGEVARPPVFLSVEEGLVVTALGTAGRTYNSALLDGAWAVLKRSLRQTSLPIPETYLAKIYGLANLGNLPKAFGTLREFEAAYGNADREDVEDLFSPFHSLKPLVMACCRDGFSSLDSVYYQLENLSKADPPYKSVTALNCIVLGCANIWDVDRAYQTFTAIEMSFGLTPDIHSYNALICAFGKLGKRDEAVKVFEHFVGQGVKPNATTYSLLVDAHLVKRDPKAALSIVDEMVIAGYEPCKDILKKVRRRCVREMDYESDDKVAAFAKQLNIRMGNEMRRNTLFNLQYRENA
ncbi:pentatricopeptide repeat-containing protein At1g26460, mitochondrial [Salvia miltiorrhiza]|uniref:pentatricopeptide repeat-containing protein At1g26460, mitochondrial n=1 Tax=Salvia miltiorrhiza TaxID=226208 RepID=UPI0025AD7917|nr:pentatricopeptide repeat-containing protein At1g26460, mitochondrial [Salvia miltiorrhiza]XP_057810757.1 pentatricopeptide repeat-containing protein At1g26460, mitochondrial [Salvia miltiorrhiza]